MLFTKAFITLMTVASTVNGLGINCRGSSSCGLAPSDTLAKLMYVVAAAPDRQYKEGEQIGCIQVSASAGEYCAFYQKINGRTYSRSQTSNYLAKLKEHGCKVCGSIPTDIPRNDVNYGMLTVNYVSLITKA